MDTATVNIESAIKIRKYLLMLEEILNDDRVPDSVKEEYKGRIIDLEANAK